jgi:hypothetical protein
MIDDRFTDSVPDPKPEISIKTYAPPKISGGFWLSNKAVIGVVVSAVAVILATLWYFHRLERERIEALRCFASVESGKSLRSG